MEGTKLELPPSHQHPAHGRCLVNISRLNVRKCQQLQRLLTGAGKNQELTSATAQKEAREDGWIDVKESEVKSSRQGLSSVQSPGQSSSEKILTFLKSETGHRSSERHVPASQMAV